MNTTAIPTSAKVIVGLSGGVDSSVAAYLLQKAGYCVEGMIMKNWEEDDTAEQCAIEQDIADAKAICTKLNIPLHIVNFSEDYRQRVFTHFLAEYQKGRTPNPDVLCNKEIKFKAFLEQAFTYGAQYIATGHYVGTQKQEDIILLTKAVDNQKDQSYFLYLLNQEQLRHSLFPLATYTKSTVRKIAAELGFPNHQKKDSTGICFIGEKKFKQFLEGFLLRKPGPICTKNAAGETITLGQHDGLMYHTIGQRKGLHIGGVKNTAEKPWYVARKEIEKNILWVVQGHDHPDLYTHQLIFSAPHWISEKTPAFPLSIFAKTRYRQIEQPCTITPTTNPQHYLATFDSPQWAITPGQSIVFYDANTCLGGGIIEEEIR